MNKVLGFAIILCLAFFASSVSFAQIKNNRDVDVANSRYLVTDSAVFEYFIQGQALPYKVYDFSTRSIYVYFGTDIEQPIVHSFEKIGEKEAGYILELGCNAAALSGGFQRFCK